MCTLSYHFSLAKTSLLAFSSDDKADTASTELLPSTCLSLFNSEAIWTLSVAVRGPISMDRSSHLDVWVSVRVCACGVWSACFQFNSWMCSAWCCHANTLMCDDLIPPLFLLGCHDVSDGNSARTLRLCSFCLLFFFSTWPRCCLPSVYVNCCHTKKSHINSKRHNKLIFVKWQDF